MARTINDIINTASHLTDAFAELWSEAEKFGEFLDNQEKKIFLTSYEGWTIEEDGNTRLITFIDEAENSITFKHAGSKYTDLILHLE